MLANRAIIVGITALIAIGVLLYNNWDVVRKKTGQLWAKLGAFKGVATIVLGPLGLIIRAAVTMAEQWDSTKSVWENVWNGIKIAAANAVNDVLGSINALITHINDIPGVNIPIIAKVDWGQTKAPRPTGTADFRALDSGRGSAGGLSYVPYDGYNARLHHGERVLTSAENKAYSSGRGGVTVTVTGNSFHVREEADIDKIIDKLAYRIEAAGNGGA